MEKMLNLTVSSTDSLCLESSATDWTRFKSFPPLPSSPSHLNEFFPLMAIYFRNARRTCVGFIVLQALTAFTLTISIVVHIPPTPCMMFVVAFLAEVLCGTWSLTKRYFGQGTQPVALEVLWAVSILPFATIAALYSPSGKPQTSLKMAHQAFTILRVILWTIVATIGVYASTVIVLTIITQHIFDRRVWYKDIDASPSPFPYRTLVNFILRRPDEEDEADAAYAAEEAETTHCQPGCTCTTKIHASEQPATLFHSPWTMQRDSSVTTMGTTTTTPSMASTPSKSTLPKAASLVRMPNDAERRTSIVVSLK